MQREQIEGEVGKLRLRSSTKKGNPAGPLEASRHNKFGSTPVKDSVLHSEPNTNAIGS